MGVTENPSEGAYNPYEHLNSLLRNSISIMCRRLCSRRSVRKFIEVIVWILVILSFIEPPAWCFDIPGIETSKEEAALVGHCWHIMSLRGPPADNPDSDQSVEYYPNSIFFLLTRTQTVAIESLCLFIIIVYHLLLIGRDGCSLAVFFRQGRSRLPRLVGTTSLAALGIGLIVAEAREGYHSR